MGFLEWTKAHSDLAALAAALSAGGGGGAIGSYLAWQKTVSPWSPNYTSFVQRTFKSNQVGKRYSQFLVDYRGSYNFYGNWVYTDEWFDRQYRNTKEHIKNSTSFFNYLDTRAKTDLGEPLSRSCLSLYWATVTDNSDLKYYGPADWEVDLWRFCSPIGYKPFNLENSQEYYEYCADNQQVGITNTENKNCIANDEYKYFKNMLASTGRPKKQTTSSGKEEVVSENPSILKLRSNDHFWYIKHLWYIYQLKYYPKTVDEVFKTHVAYVRGYPTFHKVRVQGKDMRLRDYCEAAYRLKSLKKPPLPLNILVKFCGISDEYLVDPEKDN